MKCPPNARNNPSNAKHMRLITEIVWQQKLWNTHPNVLVRNSYDAKHKSCTRLRFENAAMLRDILKKWKFKIWEKNLSNASINRKTIWDDSSMIGPWNGRSATRARSQRFIISLSKRKLCAEKHSVSGSVYLSKCISYEGEQKVRTSISEFCN